MRVSSAVVWTLVLGAAVGMPSLAVAQTGVREVSASERSLVTIQTRLRYTTMIVLPDDEEILDVVCGDKDFWIISAAQNIAHIKPAKAGAETNLTQISGDKLGLEFNGGGAWVPVASTDFLSRVQVH